RPCRRSLSLHVLQLHVVLDRLDAVHGARHADRGLDVVARAHEAAQLNDALERLDIDLGDLQTGLTEDGCLDFGSNDTVIDVLTGGLMRTRACTADRHHQCESRGECCESLDLSQTCELQLNAQWIWISDQSKCRSSRTAARCLRAPSTPHCSCCGRPQSVRSRT